MKSNNYSKIIDFGPCVTSYSSNPLAICMNDTLDNRFTEGVLGSLYGQNSAPCQMFMSDYCAMKWDENCEIASMNKDTRYPNNIGLCGGDNSMPMTSGDILIQNTASKKYLRDYNNSFWEYRPFNPTVANSPLVRFAVSNQCHSQGNCGSVPEYEVDPKTIDSDPVMDKILMKPNIAIDILANIYNTMKRRGTLAELNNTKLGRFFSVNKHYFERKMYKSMKLSY